MNKYDILISVVGLDWFYCNNWRITKDFVHPVTVNFIVVCDLAFTMNKNKYMGGLWYNKGYL